MKANKEIKAKITDRNASHKTNFREKTEHKKKEKKKAINSPSLTNGNEMV